MGTYTVRGSQELDRRIEADLGQIAAAVEPYSIAGILIGGYGRGEGTPFIGPDGTQTPFNDYDLIVVVEHVDDQVRQQFRTQERELTEKLGIHVDLCPYALDRIPSCEFSLLNYEMKYGHRVVWGDEHILDSLPAYPHDAIPRAEGMRLLLNRGKLLLDLRLRLAVPDPMSDEERIRFFKFIQKAWLALGDCSLLAEGKYDLSYAVKGDRIGQIGEVPHRAEIIENFRAAAELKAWGDYPARLEGTDIAEAFQRVRPVFLAFFAWYRKHTPARECSIAKAVALNLKWNRWPYLHHPRRRLYAALPELLEDAPDKIFLGQALCCSRDIEQRFYALQARFS